MLNYEEIYQVPDRMVDPAKARRIFQPNHFRSTGVRLLVLTMLSCLLGLLFGPTPTLHAQSIDEGLVGYWPFNEGSGATSADRSGNGNTATLSAGAYFTSDSAPITRDNPAALTFDGNAEATAPGNGMNNLQQLTIAAWVRHWAFQGGVQRYVTLGSENAVLRYDNGLHFYLKLNGSLVGVYIEEGGLPLNTYQHLAGTYDGSTLRLYLNGSLVGSQVASGAVENGNSLRFSSSDEPLAGELDEVRIYNRALTAAEIRRLAFTCAGVNEIPQAECQALATLYHSTQGDQWLNKNGWLLTNNPCGWVAVHCNAGTVISLTLNFNGLSGAIPSTLRDLSNLQALVLSNNVLSGAIPAELGNLTNLQKLNLFNNQLSGDIPPALGNLSHLQSLTLDYNQLSGAIPHELGKLTDLQSLTLDYNQLSGVIPAELSNLTSLQSLDLSNNQLNGTIPAELGMFKSLQTLELSNNQLSGIIPAELGNLAHLRTLWLDNNQLSGGIPAELSKLTSLQELGLHINHLNGAIPAELGNLTDLHELGLHTNQLSGTIPAELGNLTDLQTLGLSNNQLRGSIPATLCSLPLSHGVNFGYNLLVASDPCLVSKEPWWLRTQTVPPTALQAQVLANQQIQLTWTPITYTLDGGYYSVLAGVTAGGPYTLVAQTADKTATGITLGSLGSGTHYLIVRSFTPQHDDQQNDLTSDDSAEVVVVINQPPMAAAATLTVTQGSILPIHLHASDEDADTLHYSLISLPAHGGVSGAAPDLLYIPAPGFAGEDSFTFKVNDGKVDSSLATITLHIVAAPPVNTPPIAHSQSLTTTQATAIQLLLTATDGENDPLTYQVLSPPAHGMLGGTAPTLIYTPTDGYTGMDSLTFQVSDGHLTSAAATVEIKITAQPNHSPIAQDDAFTVTRNSQATVLAVLTNDQDADGDALRLLAVDPPLNGTAQLVNDQLLYTPTPDFVGVDRLTYTVSDDKSSSVATVSVTVLAPVEVTISQAIYLPIVQR